ncbi:hypothetical protein CYL77_07875 [Corynebacterium glutamicum]|nr:hypothetical protein B7P23_05115 [Corynebacterium glutamicum]AUI01065.1 hypothetical protein CYL77_07875 [Corynebacterium glutamicum]AUI04710.1 hypothetical protein C0I99_11570 [Corynebacterium glutamicum]CAF21562.1 putative membrane protein [Corynebacterium glutamicum ATCC 13032]
MHHPFVMWTLLLQCFSIGNVKPFDLMQIGSFEIFDWIILGVEVFSAMGTSGFFLEEGGCFFLNRTVLDSCLPPGSRKHALHNTFQPFFVIFLGLSTIVDTLFMCLGNLFFGYSFPLSTHGRQTVGWGGDLYAL